MTDFKPVKDVFIQIGLNHISLQGFAYITQIDLADMIRNAFGQGKTDHEISKIVGGYHHHGMRFTVECQGSRNFWLQNNRRIITAIAAHNGTRRVMVTTINDAVC